MAGSTSGLVSKGVPITDRSGITYYVGNAGDFWLPAFPIPAHMDYRDWVKQLKDTELRDGDILVCSFPKTGSHWNWAIIKMLLAKNTAPTSETAKLFDMSSPQEIEDLPSPRVLVTHLPFRHIPRQVFTKKVKVVYLDRNPKDTLVSMYHMLAKREDRLKYQGTFEQFFNFRMEIGGAYGDLFDYLMEWQAGIHNNPDVEIFTSVYEDMKLDPVSAVYRLNSFLHTDCSPELCQDIAQATDFDALRAAKGQGDEGKFYRKGQIGDWKNHFTVAMNERFDKEFAKRMKEYRRTYRFTQ